MFSHLPVGMQYLYVCVFSFLAGLLAPFGGGFCFFAISLLVGAGTIVLPSNIGPEQVFKSPVWSFSFPFLFTLLLLFLLIFLLMIGFGLSFSATPTSGNGYAYSFGFVGLCCCVVPLFLQMRILHLSGCLQYAAITSAVVGFVIGVGLWGYIARALIGTLFEHEHYFLRAMISGVIVVLVASSIQFFLLKSAGKKRVLPAPDQHSLSSAINK